MSDPQHIVDQIRAVMSATDQTKSPELVELASEYAALCKDANGRLRRCIDYLRRGLRSEAIHTAEEHPALLEMVATLDMPEMADWENLCAMYDMSRPPPLLMEAAQELNESYSAAEPLKVLLDQHRRLALARAPLADRIAVARQLATADPASAFWEEDVKSYEMTRLAEIKVAAGAAIKARDGATLTQLKDELATNDWRTAVPADLKLSIERAELSFRQEAALQTVRGWLPEIDAAYSAMDAAAAKDCVARVRELAQSCQLVLPADVSQMIEPVEQWLLGERQKRHKHRAFVAAVQALQDALDGGAPLEELREFQAQAAAFGEELPDPLAKAVRLAIGRHVARRKRAMKLRWTFIGVASAGLIVMLGIFVWSQVNERHGQEAAHTLARLTENQQFDEATAYWNGLTVHNPSFTGRADVKRAKEELDEALLQERDRIANFQSHWKAASTGGAAAADFHELAQAETLARTTQEKELVSSFRTKAEAEQHKLKMAAETTYKAKVAELRTKTEAVETQAQSDPTSAADLPDLQPAQALAAQLTGANDAPTESLAEARSLADRLHIVSQARLKNAHERDLLRALAGATASPDDLKKALEQFVMECPDSVHTVAFKEAIEQAPAWKAADEYAKIFAGWGGSPRPAPAEAKERGDAVQAYLAAYPQSVFAPALQDYKAYLAACQKAVSSEGWRGDFTSVLDSPLVHKLKCLHATNDRIFYLAPDETIAKNSVGESFKYVVTGDVSVTKRVTLKPEEVVGDLGPSPQSQYAEAILKKLESLDQNWELFGCDALEELAENKEIDPILRVILFNRALVAARVSNWGDDVFKTTGDKLADLNADDLAWMNPEDTDANAARPKARDLLAQDRGIKEAKAAIQKKRDELFASLRFAVAGHSVLLKSGSNYTIPASDGMTKGQAVMAISTAGNRVSLIKIAEYGQGGIVIDKAAAGAVSEGEMLFIVTTGGPGV